MASAFQGIEFVIDGKRSHLLLREIPRINSLFKVDISFKENFPVRKEDGDVKQWIHINGPISECNNAKNYIIAFSSPECHHRVQGMKLNPIFTEEKRVEIERSAQAVLTFQDGCEDLIIYGTELSVAVAQSLIDDLLSKFTKKDATSNFDDYVIIDKDEVDCLHAMDENTIALRAVHVAKNPQRKIDSTTRQPNMTNCVSSTRQSNMTTHNSPSVSSPVSRSGQKPCNGIPKTNPPLQNALRPSAHQNGQCLPQQKDNCGQQTFQSHGNEQATSLWQMALIRGHSPEDIEKGLSCYDMNNIVQPAEFLKTVDDIKTSRHRPSNVPCQLTMAQSPGRDLHFDLNDSVICLGAEAPKITASPIMISDDEDIEMDTAETGTSGPSNTRGVSRVPALDPNKSGPLNTREVSRVPALDPNKSGPLNTREVSRVPALDPNKSKAPQLQQMDISRPAPISSQITEEPPEPEEATEPKQYRKDLRYIVIDGSNVAMAHGSNKVFSVRGIEIAVQFFKARGHDRITVFVPESRRYGDPSKGVFNTEPIRNKYLLEKLNKEGILKFTPARRVDGRLIASYDDRYILKLACQEDGIIVSNDQFRDLTRENANYKKLVDSNLLQFLFVGDEFMPPDDPFGRYGVDIDDFLKYPAFRGPKSNVPVKDTKKPWQVPVATKSKRNGPRRSRELTQKLYDQLTQVFPEDKQSMSVYQVLENHCEETDLVKLTNYVLNALFS